MKKLLGCLILVLAFSATCKAQSWSGQSTSNARVVSPYRFCVGSDNGQDVCLQLTAANVMKVLNGSLDYALVAMKVAQLPPAAANAGRVYRVTDGTSNADCSAGGGSTSAVCVSDGTSWGALGGVGTGTVQSANQYAIFAQPNPGSNAVAGPTNLSTDSTHNNLNVPGNEMVTGDAYFHSGEPWYDVKTFGAKCDGSTDDTTAVQAAYAQAWNDLVAGSGGGVVYFPHSSGACKVGTITMYDGAAADGWIVSKFDNGLIATELKVGNYNAFIGSSGGFQGLAGAGIITPGATITQPSGQSVPLVEIKGKSGVYFQGINLECFSSSECVHTHDDGAGNGSVNMHWENDTIGNNGAGQALVSDSSGNTIISGFGQYFDHVVFNMQATSGPMVEFYKFRSGEYHAFICGT